MIIQQRADLTHSVTTEVAVIHQDPRYYLYTNRSLRHCEITSNDRWLYSGGSLGFYSTVPFLPSASLSYMPNKLSLFFNCYTVRLMSHY